MPRMTPARPLKRLVNLLDIARFQDFEIFIFFFPAKVFSKKKIFDINTWHLPFFLQFFARNQLIFTCAENTAKWDLMPHWIFLSIRGFDFFSKSNWTGNFATWFGTTWGYHFGIDLRKVALAIWYGLGQVSFNGFSCPKTTTGFSKSLDWFENFTWVVSTGNLPQVVIDSPWKRAQARPFGTLMVCDGFCHSVSMWLYMHKNMYAHIRTYTNSLHLWLCILVSICNFQTPMCMVYITLMYLSL